MAAVRRDTVAVDDTQGHAFDDGRPGTGPYDVDAIDPEATDAGGLVDFGAIRLPVPPRGTVALEPGEGGRMQAVHVSLPEGRLSVSALAAPKSSALWPELAKEINASLRDGGARVRSFSGEWGRELHATTGAATSVFVGVDGPRWMLYGVATGPTRDAGALDTELRRMLRGVVVVRGKSPYPVRTVLPLATPEHLAAMEAAEKAPPTTAITVQKPPTAAPAPATTALPVQQRSAAATGAHPLEPAAPPPTTALPVQPAAGAPLPVEPVTPATTALPVQPAAKAGPQAPPTTAMPMQPRPRPSGAPETVAVPWDGAPRFPAPSETRAMRPPAVPAARNGSTPGPQAPAPNGAPPAVGGPRVPVNPLRGPAGAPNGSGPALPPLRPVDGTGRVPAVPPLRPAAGQPLGAAGPRGLAEPPIGPADTLGAAPRSPALPPPVPPVDRRDPARGIAASTEFGPRGLPATSTGSIPAVPPLLPGSAPDQRSAAIPLGSATSRPAPGVPEELAIPSWDAPMWADPVQRISDVDDSPLLNLGIDPDDILPLDATPAREPLPIEPFGTGAWPVSTPLPAAEETAPPAEISLADTPIAAALSGETATEPQSLVATGSGHSALDPETSWDDPGWDGSVPADPIISAPTGRRALREPEVEVAAEPTGRRALRDPLPEEPTGRRARREPEPERPEQPSGRRSLREPVPTEPWALESVPVPVRAPAESAVTRSGRHLAVRPAAEETSPGTRPGRHAGSGGASRSDQLPVVPAHIDSPDSPDDGTVSRSGRDLVVPAAALLAESAVTRTGRRRARTEETDTALPLPLEAAARESAASRYLGAPAAVPPAAEPPATVPPAERPGRRRRAETKLADAAPFADAPTVGSAPDSGLLGSDLFGSLAAEEPSAPRRGRRRAEPAADAPTTPGLVEPAAADESSRPGRRRAEPVADLPSAPVPGSGEPVAADESSRSRRRHAEPVGDLPFAVSPGSGEPVVADEPSRRGHRRAEPATDVSTTAVPGLVEPAVADESPLRGRRRAEPVADVSPALAADVPTAEESARRGRRYADPGAEAPSVFALAERLSAEPSRRGRRRAVEEPPPEPPAQPQPQLRPEPEAWPLSRGASSYEMIPVEVNPVRIHVPPVPPESTWRKDPGLSGFALFDADPNEPRPNRFGRSDETGPSPVYTPLLVRLGPRNAELPTGDWPMVEPAREYPWTRKFTGNGASAPSSVLTGERAAPSPWDDLDRTEPVVDLAGRGRHYRPDRG